MQVINTRCFGRFWPVSWTTTHQFGVQSDLYGCRSPRCAYVSFINNRHFGRFWPVSWAITHHFGVPVRFPCLLNYKVLLRAGHRHSPFWPVLARFMDYYSPFWGPEAIFMVAEPQGALTYHSSTITVLADSDPFYGLLLTFLG